MLELAGLDHLPPHEQLSVSPHDSVSPSEAVSSGFKPVEADARMSGFKAAGTGTGFTVEPCVCSPCVLDYIKECRWCVEGSRYQVDG